MTAGRRLPENSQRHYTSTARSWGFAFMSFFFHSKDYISGAAEPDDLPSEGKRGNKWHYEDGEDGEGSERD